MPLMKTNTYWRKTLQILESVPSDGCLLVFNGREQLFRKAASLVYRGLFHVQVAVEMSKANGGPGRPAIRDLYITWKE
jgi:hypothetical protein